PDANAACARKKKHGKGRAENAAMERHAAIPYGRNGEGIGEIKGEIVKQHIADASAQHDAQSGPDHEIIERFGLYRRLAVCPEAVILQQFLAIPPGKKNADD